MSYIHQCELKYNSDFTYEIYQMGLSPLYLSLPYDCGDPQCGCTLDVPIEYCPVCGYKYQKQERPNKEMYGQYN